MLLISFPIKKKLLIINFRLGGLPHKSEPLLTKLEKKAIVGKIIKEHGNEDEALNVPWRLIILLSITMSFFPIRKMSNSPLAAGTITTRRRPIEYAEENGNGKVNIGQHHRRITSSVNSLMRPGRYLSRWIFCALMLLMVSTMFVKIILIHLFLRVNATMTCHDFLQLPPHIIHAQVHQSFLFI